jgi:hypothetical protein
MVSHPSSPVTRRCHIIDNRHSMQVSKNTVSKNTAADFHRRRLLILCAVASCRSIALDSSETFTPERRRDRSQQAGELDELGKFIMPPSGLCPAISRSRGQVRSAGGLGRHNRDCMAASSYVGNRGLVARYAVLADIVDHQLAGSRSLVSYLHYFPSADHAQPGNFPGLLKTETTFASSRETLLERSRHRKRHCLPDC